jgi:ABC-type phosphate transport system substrate-binding protein
MKTNGDHLVKRIPILLFGSLIPLLCTQAHAQVVVIANPNVAAASVSRTELRDVFTGASSSLSGGAQVTPVLLKQGAAHDEFLSIYIGKSGSAFRAGWRSILFSGQGIMPKSLDSDAAVVEYVAHTPGAIGYIGKTSSHDGVKILVVRRAS